MPDVEVSPEQVKAAIMAYADDKEKEGSRQIPVILRTAELKFEGSLVTLVLNNETQKEQFMLIRQSFLDDIRVRLQSSRIQIETDITEHQAQVKAYKPVDIFKAMTDKNPALMELKKRFDLEIDY